MKISLKNSTIILFWMLCIHVQIISAQQTNFKQIISLNKNWKFHLGSTNNPSKDFDYGIVRNFTIAGGGGGCIVPEFEDDTWRTVNVPHDWAVELPFEYHKHFDVQSHGYRPVGGFYPDHSIGWYRKHFSVDKAKKGQRVVIRFEGVYRDFKIWVNNNYIGGSSNLAAGNYDITIRYTSTTATNTTYTMNFAGGNKIQDAASTTSNSNESGKYQYDFNINPYAHMNWPDLYLSNQSRNNLKRQERHFAGAFPTAIPYGFEYTYDEDGYPKELVKTYFSYYGIYMYTTKTVYNY